MSDATGLWNCNRRIGCCSDDLKTRLIHPSWPQFQELSQRPIGRLLTEPDYLLVLGSPKYWPGLRCRFWFLESLTHQPQRRPTHSRLSPLTKSSSYSSVFSFRSNPVQLPT